MKVLVLNLDRSADRLAFIQSQCQALGVVVERLPAVDGRADGFQAVMDSLAHRRWIIQPPSAVEVAVLLSHQKAWQLVVDEQLPAAIVLEDDVVLSPGFAELVQLSHIPDVDIIRLETQFRKVLLGDTLTLETPGHMQCRHLLSWHGGTAGYMVTEAGARRLLAMTQPYLDNVDSMLFNPMSPVCRQLRNYQMVPALCAQDQMLAQRKGQPSRFQTTIGRVGPVSRRLFRHGWAIQLRRLAYKLVERIGRNYLRWIKKIDYLVVDLY